MRLVVPTEPGVVELQWMWLPTWLGHNSSLKKELEAALHSKLEGRPIDDETLDLGHELVIEFLEGRFPAIQGLRDHLDGLKYVHYHQDEKSP